MLNVELNKKELLKIEKFLRDEVREHPAIFGAVVNGIKTNKSKVIYSVTPKELALLKKILAVKNPVKKRKKKKENPEPRTILLRKAGVIPVTRWVGGNQYGPSETTSKKRRLLEDEWLGGNQFKAVKPRRKAKKPVKSRKKASK